MSQLNLYLPAALERKIRAEARRKRVSLSKYVASILAEKTGEMRGFSSDFLSRVIGGWRGEPPQIEPLAPEERDGF